MSVTPSSISTVSPEDAATIRDLHAGFIWGWDREPGQGHWDFYEIQGRYYDRDFDGGRFYDDMDPEHRVARNVEEYRAIWEPTFNELRAATHRIEEGPEIFGTPELVSSRLVFLARLVTADGSVVDIRTHNSLTWYRFPDGWKIVGDHTSSQVLEPGEADRLLETLPGAASWR
jgi:ketosteroid isomerase-like protein